VEYTVEPTESLHHAEALGRAAAADARMAVAFGGDGMVAAVAEGIRAPRGLLGVLPGGRGNDFARVLGIPLEPVAACRVLVAGVARELDLGQVGTRTFVGIASCGFDSEANRIANQTRLVRGNLVYAYGALRALLGWQSARFRVTLDHGEAREVTGYSVAMANSKAYGGGMLLAPDASLQDGLLDVVIIGEVPKLRFLRLLPTVFKGEHVRQPNVQILRAGCVEVSADRPFTMYADGDPIAELPATVRALPAALRVMVPV
jgi:YegS/Rv2252/BmrU family lipid kinase